MTRSEQRRLFREHVARIVAGWKVRVEAQARSVRHGFVRHAKTAAPVFRSHHLARLRS